MSTSKSVSRITSDMYNSSMLGLVWKECFNWVFIRLTTETFLFHLREGGASSKTLFLFIFCIFFFQKKGIFIVVGLKTLNNMNQVYQRGAGLSCIYEFCSNLVLGRDSFSCLNMFLKLYNKEKSFNALVWDCTACLRFLFFYYNCYITD